MAYFRKKWIHDSCLLFLYENKQDTFHHNIQVTDIIKLTNTACFINCNDGFYSIKAIINLQVVNSKQVPIAGQFLNIKDYYFEYYKGEFVLFITKYILFGSFSDPSNTTKPINNKFRMELQSELYNEFNFDDYRDDDIYNSFIDNLTKPDFNYEEYIQSSGSVFTSIPFERSIIQNENNNLNKGNSDNSNKGNSDNLNKGNSDNLNNEYSDNLNNEYSECIENFIIENIFIENTDSNENSSTESSEKNLESPFTIKVLDNKPAGNTTTQNLLAFCPFTEPEDELLRIGNTTTQFLIENNFTQTQAIKKEQTQNTQEVNTQEVNTQLCSLPPSTDLANYNLDPSSNSNTQDCGSLNDLPSSFLANTQIIEPLLISFNEIIKTSANEKPDILEIPELVSRIYNPYLELTKINKTRDITNNIVNPNNSIVDVNTIIDINNTIIDTNNTIIDTNNTIIDNTDLVNPSNTIIDTNAKNFNFLYISNKKLANTLNLKKRPLVLNSNLLPKRQKWTLDYNSINSRFKKVNYRLPRGEFDLKELYYLNVIEGMTRLFEYKEDNYKYTDTSKIRYFDFKPHNKVLGYPLKTDIDEYEFLREKEIDIMFDPFYDIFDNVDFESFFNFKE